MLYSVWLASTESYKRNWKASAPLYFFQRWLADMGPDMIWCPTPTHPLSPKFYMAAEFKCFYTFFCNLILCCVYSSCLYNFMVHMCTLSKHLYHIKCGLACLFLQYGFRFLDKMNKNNIAEENNTLSIYLRSVEAGT